MHFLYLIIFLEGQLLYFSIEQLPVARLILIRVLRVMWVNKKKEEEKNKK